jgi:GTP pyrophosphokinase
MQTLSFLPPEKQKRIARETLEVYAPLAERLGIGEMKGKLEDLAFPYLYPREYQWVKELAEPYYYEAKVRLQEGIDLIKKKLKAEKIEAEIRGRTKHLYSLYTKLLRPEENRDIEKIYDLVAMRIIVESIHNCYAALGVVHKIWKPAPFKGVSDFIAQPKPNGYRSLHTNVFGPGGKIFEVQIRTQEMHEQAENGIAAHWYLAMLKTRGKLTTKEVDKGEFFAPTETLSWVKQLVAWQKEMVDSHEFLQALKFDALAHRIFVFSPQGDVYDLPAGATPIDFAYAVHTDVGDQTIGAKVNEKMAKLDYHLKSGDIVQIIRKKGTGPSRDWLNFVITTTARKQISRHFKGLR